MARTNLSTFRLCGAALCLTGSDRFGPDGRIPRGWRIHTTLGPVCPHHARLFPASAIRVPAPRCARCHRPGHVARECPTDLFDME